MVYRGMQIWDALALWWYLSADLSNLQGFPFGGRGLLTVFGGTGKWLGLPIQRCFTCFLRHVSPPLIKSHGHTASDKLKNS